MIAALLLALVAVMGPARAACVGAPDGNRTGAEDCDGADFSLTPGNGSSACATYNSAAYSAGTLSCSPTCTVVVTACLAACQDTVDNDSDGWSDLADPGCSSPVDNAEGGFGSAVCNNGGDDDGDGAIDSADAGCSSATDTNEANCGDATRNGTEACDGSDFATGAGLGSAACADFDPDYTSGTLTCSGSCAVVETACVTFCEDLLDNDGDGWADLADPDCATGDSELGYGAAACNNNLDDDGDGWLDVDDPGCATASDTNEADAGTAACNNGVDNDGDGWVDELDPGCSSGGDTDEADLGLFTCTNGADDDGDGWADAEDPGCSSGADTTEADAGTTVCNNGADDDADGWADELDPGCDSGTDASEADAGTAVCNNGLDDDGDGWIDEDDAGCSSGADSSEANTSTAACGNLADDDADGWIDGADPGCSSGADTSEADAGITICNNGADDDGDGWADALDPGCADGGDATEADAGATACSNGADDDGDGWIDASDPGCTSGADGDEGGFGVDVCNDDDDNDGDGWVDAEDPGCSSGADTSEVLASTAVCNNGLDDDGDGWADGDDPGCASATDSTETGGGSFECSNGADDDADGWTDAEDPGCTSGRDDDESGAGSAECGDGADNDGDGWVDVIDPGCDDGFDADESDGVTGQQCGNQVDDDGDGDVDGLDAGCSGPTDVSEADCGDGVVSGAEDCDGADVDGQTCVSQGFDAGTLGCAADCSFDTSGCVNEVCNGVDDDGDGRVDEGFADTDRDGIADCVDSEVCDGLDNDGDGLVDDADPTVDSTSFATFFPDADGDGYADLLASSRRACQAPVGFLRSGGQTDCDDGNPAVNPGATEVCDGLDNDCDELSDDDDPSIYGLDPSIVPPYRYYTDEDRDGYGDPGDLQLRCGALSSGELLAQGLAANNLDCDDADVLVAPGATEVCDGRRNDCSTGTGTPLDEIDLDGDGYVECGFDGTITWQGSGSVNVGEDCGPRDPTTHPYATEICDGIYNNCEAPTYSATQAPANETDDDGDAYVECFDGTTTWQGPRFTPLSGLDCDDGDGTVYPSAPELCDGQFNDCEDPLLGSEDAPSDEVDGDGDGYVGCTAYSAATWQGGPVSGGGDCAPADGAVHPGALEAGVCDGVDTNCDGGGLWAEELDADGDGFVTCNYRAATWKGSTEVLGGLDCDDGEDQVYPGAAEVCDGRFNDCEDRLYNVQDAPSVELDDDGDGYVECWDGSTDWQGDPGVFIGEDCDDDDAFAFPGAAPLDDPAGCLRDADLDLFGDLAAVDPVEAGTDCDDGDPLTWPGAPELCEDDAQRDNDCDGNPNTQGGDALPDSAGGAIVVYVDADGDGWGDEAADPTRVCDRNLLEGVYAYTSSDCDDTNPTVFPGAPEICNGFDDNCNDQIDRGDELDADLSGCVEMFRDLDRDGYGDEAQPACLCQDESDPLGTDEEGDRYVIFGQDCDDSDADTRPLSCKDGIDNDPLSGDGVDAADPDCAAGLNEGGTEVEQPFEKIDGNDNDCDGDVAAVELDCDDDGSVALLPRQQGALLRAEEAGLLPCGDDGAVTTLACWGEPALQLRCEGESGLWVYRYADADDALVAERFDGGRRTWTGARPCSAPGDCDDQCPSRCPDLVEACDGIDNDCSGADLGAQGPAEVAGLPRSMLAGDEIPGTVTGAELDIDQDGFLACDDLALSGAEVHMAKGSCADLVVDPALLSDCAPRCGLSFPAAEERCNGFLDTCGGEGEGADADFDSYRTCGAWSAGGQDELPEDVYLLVWIAPEDRAGLPPDSGGRDSSVRAETGAPDSGPADTAAREVEGLSDPAVPLLLPRAHPRTDGAARAADPARRVFRCEDPVDPERPMREVYACDEPLFDALAALVGGAALQAAICDDDGAALLGACRGTTGECGLLRLTLDPDVDTDLWDELLPRVDVDPACEARPEELISRGVWPAGRILSARDAVIAWECERMYGLPCADIQPSTSLSPTWDRMPDASDALAASRSWWKELDRFALEPVLTGTVGWCWGDPSADGGQARGGDRTGGDCADGQGGAHRDAAEGPGDLMGLLDPEGVADCGTCLDGIDNNCDGQIDCADPACAPCFVGQGVGCGGGDQSPCAGAGCSARPSSSAHRGLVLGLVGLLGLLLRRPRRSAA